MKKKLLAIFLGTTMALALAACGDKEADMSQDTAAVPAVSAEVSAEQADEADTSDKAAAAEVSDDVQLADWNGEWNSIVHYLDKEEVQDAYKEKAEKIGETDLEKVKADYKSSVETDYESMVVEDDTITFYSAPRAEGGEEIEKTEYEYVTAHPMEHGGKTYHWYEFKAKSADSAHPVILLMDIHGESVLAHFHMRYGKDAAEILADEDWYPTFFKPDGALSQIAEEIAE